MENEASSRTTFGTIFFPFHVFQGTAKPQNCGGKVEKARANKYKKYGPQSPDCYRFKNALFHQGIITMITTQTVCFKTL